MNTGSDAAERHANQVTQILDQVLGPNRFPVNVRDVALQISRSKFPKEPIEQIIGEDLPRFDGAIKRLSGESRGWVIIYNSKIRSKGRINFTLAHEFGHYLVHRTRLPTGLSCDPEDIVRGGSVYKAIEAEANTFAAYLLMPFNDFREQIPADERPTWDDLSRCAERYDVSLVAATLRWLEYTSVSAILVVSRDGFVDWGKSSKKAYASGRYFRKSNLVEVPVVSPAADSALAAGKTEPIRHPAGVWFDEPVTEAAIRSDAYDFTMSLLIF